MTGLNFLRRLKDKDPARTVSNVLLLAAGVFAAIVMAICVLAVAVHLTGAPA